jgi:hypothetical protein
MAATTTKKTERVPMQVPPSFHKLLSQESDRRGVPMTALLTLYGDRMIAAIRD